MAKLQLARMHLTHDEELVVSANGHRSIAVRVRCWRRMGARAVVLVESAEPGGRSVRPWAGRVALVVNRDIMGGSLEYSYVERDGAPHSPLETFRLVHFMIHRLAYAVEPWREPLTRRDVEFQVGGPV